MSSIKKILPLLLIWLTTSFYGLAQTETDYTVNTGEVAIQVIPMQEQYRFLQFRPGEVYFRNNTFIRATLNYNLLYGEMQFINSKGDTLSLAGGYKLKKITIGDTKFYYAYKIGHLEVVSSYPQVQLARKQNLELTRSGVDLTSRSIQPDPIRVIGMDSHVTPGSSIIGKDWNLLELYTKKAPGDLHFTKKATYFIVDKNERFYPAKKSTVIKLFSRHKKAIDAYIKDNNPDFNLENDLQQLLAFCSRLGKK